MKKDDRVFDTVSALVEYLSKLADKCPHCGNNDRDTLVWQGEQEVVRCKCGHMFSPEV